MNLKLSNKTFYARHINEIEKFLIFEKSLHIINYASLNKFKIQNSDYLTIDFEIESHEKIDTINKTFDTIVLTDIIEVSEDIYLLLSTLKKILNPGGKLVVTSINTKWITLNKIIEFFKIKDKSRRFSYIHNNKIKNIAIGAGYEYLKHSSRQFFPFKLFSIGTVINGLLETVLFPFNLGIRTYTIFKTQDINKQNVKKSIIIPAKNEEGNLQKLIERIPRNEMYQLIIVCGKSTDKTFEKAIEIKNQESFFEVEVLMQSNNGKANAVWEALEKAKGEYIAILDADISVDPETIPVFFSILESTNADFVNGTRLIYNMDNGAMRIINKIGNRLFQNIISFLLKTNLTDSLCGTKVFRKSLIPKIIWWQKKFNSIDPFGDFDLIFAAAYTGEKIVEYPIHYRARTYGVTQISRFKDGIKLINYLLKSFIIFNTSKK